MCLFEKINKNKKIKINELKKHINSKKQRKSIPNRPTNNPPKTPKRFKNNRRENHKAKWRNNHQKIQSRQTIRKRRFCKMLRNHTA